MPDLITLSPTLEVLSRCISFQKLAAGRTAKSQAPKLNIKVNEVDFFSNLKRSLFDPFRSFALADSLFNV